MKFVPKALTRFVGRSNLKLEKNSPHILFGVGIVGGVGATVLACRASMDLREVVSEIQDDVTDVKEIHEDKTTLDYRKDLGYVYWRGALRLGKMYGPSIAVGTLSIAALGSSHVTLSKRNNTLTAALSATILAYETYREKVREEIGAEREKELYYSVENTIVEEDENNSKVVKTADPTGISQYARFFDEFNENYEKTADLNKLFIQCQQTLANTILINRGHLFLNEVYDWLGLERSRVGSLVGWVYDSDGDNYVDFSMYNTANRQFINGNERAILLDFNVDGVIWDKI